MILRQFEGAAAPAKYFCLFLQDKRFTWSYVLFTIRVTLKQTRSDSFTIVADISHMERTVDLRKRGDKSILVRKEGALVDSDNDESNYVRIETMHPSIENYRSLYAEDLSQRLGLNETRLKPELTFSVLLNPLFGLEKRIVGAGLLTSTQYYRAKSGKYYASLHLSASIPHLQLIPINKLCPSYCGTNLALIHAMQDYLDAKHPTLCVDSDDGMSNESDSNDGYVVEKTNSNYNRAEEEFNTFESFKRNKYRPKWARVDSEILSGTEQNGTVQEIIVGPAEENGKDLPSEKNLGDYVNEKGRMDVLKFFEDHKKYFPTLWIIAQREAARRVVEVGCERFFGLSGYISSPRRSRLGVRTYERVAMLASIIQNVYIDNDWVAQEYIERCKRGSWKKESTEEALKCWNLERIIDAEQQGNDAPSELRMED
jgi:hypothetical protein